MKYYANSSIIYADVNRASNHKARFKIENKKKFFSSNERYLRRAFLLFHWNRQNVPGWTRNYWTINSARLARIKTIKRSCMYSNRCRSVNAFLGMSKYKIADFSRRGLIKDLKKF